MALRIGFAFVILGSGLPDHRPVQREFETYLHPSKLETSFGADERALIWPEKPAAPAILIWWQPGTDKHRLPPLLEVAVWDSGRILWREPALKVTLSKKGGLKASDGDYREAMVSQQRVKFSLLRLQRQRVFETWWANVGMHSSSTQMIVRFNHDMTRLMTRKEPETVPKWAAKDNPGAVAWLQVRKEVKGLIPAYGRKTVAPDSQELRNWAKDLLQRMKRLKGTGLSSPEK